MSDERSVSWGTNLPRERKYRTNAPLATLMLIAAAAATEPDCPRSRMVILAARKQAPAEPRVLTKYSIPTDWPMFPESWAMWATNKGRVQPISKVGITTKTKEIRPV